MLGPAKPRRLDQPIAVSLEDLVPADHFYRHLEAKLDLSFVRDWTRQCYADRGRPSIDPVVFFKLQFVMFFEGIRSERKLIETARLTRRSQSRGSLTASTSTRARAKPSSRGSQSRRPSRQPASRRRCWATVPPCSTVMRASASPAATGASRSSWRVASGRQSICQRQRMRSPGPMTTSLCAPRDST